MTTLKLRKEYQKVTNSNSNTDGDNRFSKTIVLALVRKLSSSSSRKTEQAIRALGDILEDGPPEIHDFLINIGIVQILLSLIKPKISISILRNVARVIYSLCMHEEFPPDTRVIVEILPALNALIEQTDTFILVDTTWAIESLFQEDNEDNINEKILEMVIENGLVPKMIPLLHHAEVQVQTAALRAVSHLLAGTDEQTQLILNHGILSYFPTLLSHPKEYIRRKTLWTLLDLTGGTELQVQAVINARLLPKIIENLGKGELQTRKVALWPINNLIIEGNKKQILFLIREGVVLPFCNLLACNDWEVIHDVLRGLMRMLKKLEERVLEIVNLIEKCNGLEKIQRLKNHENVEFREMATEIIMRYFFG